MALSGNVLVQGRGKKKVLSTHGGYFHTTNYSFMKQLHWRFLAGSILRQYDAVLASSTADRANFKSKAPYVRLLANGVNVSKFISIDIDKSPNPLTRWIYWGRLSKNKRLDLLVDTVKQARDAGLAIDLTIAGADFDGLLPSIRGRISKYGLDKHIHFVGQLSDADLLAEIATQTVFITASEYEGFGLSVIEAMAAGLMVICRNVAPLNDFVVSGKNGAFIAFDGSSSDLASIKALCALSTAESSAMQRFARATALPHSWETVVKHYIAVYHELTWAKTTAA
jgi:alpha-1,3-mannosyltransferase